MNALVNALNDYSGVISLVGAAATIISVFIAYYLNFRSDKKRLKKTSLELKETLVIELLANLTFLSSIKTQHEKNLSRDDNDTFLVPTRSPRVSVISNLFEYDQLTSFNKEEKYYFSNVFGKLTKFEKEFYIYRDYLMDGLITNKQQYVSVSTPMENSFSHLLESIMYLWVKMIDQVGKNSIHPFVKKISKEIRKLKNSGYDILIYYDSKDFEVDNRKSKLAIVCWINNGIVGEDIKILEINSMIPPEGI